MARVLLRRYIVKALEELEEATTGEIVQHVCRSYKWGVSMPSVGNLLTRLPEFQKVGFVNGTQEDPMSGIRVRQVIWRLVDE